MVKTNSVDQPEPMGVVSVRAETAVFLAKLAAGDRTAVGDLMRQTSNVLTGK